MYALLRATIYEKKNTISVEALKKVNTTLRSNNIVARVFSAFKVFPTNRPAEKTLGRGWRSKSEHDNFSHAKMWEESHPPNSTTSPKRKNIELNFFSVLVIVTERREGSSDVQSHFKALD